MPIGRCSLPKSSWGRVSVREATAERKLSHRPSGSGVFVRKYVSTGRDAAPARIAGMTAFTRHFPAVCDRFSQ